MKQKLAVLAVSVMFLMVATDATAGRFGRSQGHGLRGGGLGCPPGGYSEGPLYGGGFYGGYSAPRPHLHSGFYGAPSYHRYSSPSAYPYYHASPYYEVYEGSCPPSGMHPAPVYPGQPVTPIPTQPAPVPPPGGQAPVPPPAIEPTPAPTPVPPAPVAPPAAPEAPAPVPPSPVPPTPAPATDETKPPAPPL